MEGKYPFGERIKQLVITFAGGNNSVFANKLEVTEGSIRSYMRGTIPKADIISKIVEIYDVSPAWLLLGEGEILKKSSGIDPESVKSDPASGLNYIPPTAPTEAESDDLRAENVKIYEKANGKMIPFYDAETTGGYTGVVSSSSVDVHLAGYINAGGWFDGRESAAIRHVGDSMSEYPDGCILAVKEVKNRRLLVPGKNYVIETDEYRITKRVQRGSSPDTIALYSTNKETYSDGRLIYEPFEISLEDVRRIFTVLGYIVNQQGETSLIRP